MEKVKEEDEEEEESIGSRHPVITNPISTDQSKADKC